MVRVLFRLKSLSLLLLLLLTPAIAKEGYLNLYYNKGGRPVRLDSAIARFKSPQGQVVDLVGVIHVADAAYYQRLNKHFRNYDSVLYEMVLDVPKQISHQNEIREILGKDAKEPKIDTTKGGRDSLSLFQVKLAEVLGLQWQLDEIDYTAENFRHADLTLEEFEEAMKDKKSSPLQILKDLLGATDEKAPKEYQKIAQLPLLKILSQGPTEEERRILKIGLAAYFGQYKDLGQGQQGEVLIKMRDAKAIEVLKKRLSKGEKKVAIFYGAAHMPDLSQRLRKMGFKAINRSWLKAWDL